MKDTPEKKPRVCQHCEKEPVNSLVIAGQRFWYCYKHYNEMKRATAHIRA